MDSIQEFVRATDNHWQNSLLGGIYKDHVKWATELSKIQGAVETMCDVFARHICSVVTKD